MSTLKRWRILSRKRPPTDCERLASTFTVVPQRERPKLVSIIADTKFEFGFDGETLLLIDEVLTPDSSRFWPAEQYQPGRAQASYDKQFVREWLMASHWDRNSPPPPLPADVIEKTRQKYVQARDLLVPNAFHSAIGD